jgi:RNA polymerase sigma-70 factor (ECF subfamily)
MTLSISASHSTSLSLIRKVQLRDEHAWECLAQLYGPMVYRWARMTGLAAPDAADVVQNVFLNLLRKIDRFSADHPGASFRGWLWTVTRNAVREYLRRQNGQARAQGGSTARQQFEQLPIEEPPEEEPDSSSTQILLAHRAAQLIREHVDPTTWESFWRSTVHGESAGDIAADLGLTPQAVRQSKYRVLCRLRELLADR